MPGAPGLAPFETRAALGSITPSPQSWLTPGAPARVRSLNAEGPRGVQKSSPGNLSPLLLFVVNHRAFLRLAFGSGEIVFHGRSLSIP
jgi:hypothetical protein